MVTLRTPIPQQLDTSLPGSSPSSHGGSIHSTLTGHSTLSGHTTPVLGEPSVVPRRFPRIHPSLPSQNASSHKMAESRPRAGWDGRERLQAQKLCAPPVWEHTHTHRHKRHTHVNTHVHTPAPGHQPCLRSQEFPEHRAWGHRQPFHGQGGWPQDGGTPSPGCLLCQGGGPEPRMCTGASGIHLPLLLLRGVRAALRGGRARCRTAQGWVQAPRDRTAS